MLIQPRSRTRAWWLYIIPIRIKDIKPNGGLVLWSVFEKTMEGRAMCQTLFAASYELCSAMFGAEERANRINMAHHVYLLIWAGMLSVLKESHLSICSSGRTD